MFKSILAALVFLPVVSLAANKATDEKYFSITSVSTTALPVTTVNMLSTPIGASDCSGADFANPPAANPADPLDQTDLIVDKIINIGKKIWAIIELGRPKVDIKTDVATALPKGAHCWMDLQQWQAPKTQVYNVAMKNAYGMDVVKFAYRVEYLAGGSVNGTGKYIGYATMVPADVYVAWGFNLDATAKVPTVFNMGTREAPVAGMQMEVSYKVHTVMNELQGSKAFFINGLGNLEQMP